MRGIKRLISIPLAIIVLVVGLVLMKNVGGDSSPTTTTLTLITVPGIDSSSYDPTNPLKRVTITLEDGSAGYVTPQVVLPPGIPDDFSVVVYDAATAGKMIGTWSRAKGFTPLG